MPIKNPGSTPRHRHRLIPITRPMGITVISVRRKLSQLQNALIVLQVDGSWFVTPGLVLDSSGWSVEGFFLLGSLCNGLHGIADGALLVIVVIPALQKGQIIATTVVRGFQQDLQSVFDSLGIELAQEFGAALIHAL